MAVPKRKKQAHKAHLRLNLQMGSRKISQIFNSNAIQNSWNILDYVIQDLNLKVPSNWENGINNQFLSLYNKNKIFLECYFWAKPQTMCYFDNTCAAPVTASTTPLPVNPTELSEELPRAKRVLSWKIWRYLPFNLFMKAKKHLVPMQPLVEISNLQTVKALNTLPHLTSFTSWIEDGVIIRGYVPATYNYLRLPKKNIIISSKANTYRHSLFNKDGWFRGKEYSLFSKQKLWTEWSRYHWFGLRGISASNIIYLNFNYYDNILFKRFQKSKTQYKAGDWSSTNNLKAKVYKKNLSNIIKLEIKKENFSPTQDERRFLLHLNKHFRSLRNSYATDCNYYCWFFETKPLAVLIELALRKAVYKKEYDELRSPEFVLVDHIKAGFKFYNSRNTLLLNSTRRLGDIKKLFN